jgi:hypothetical protein
MRAISIHRCGEHSTLYPKPRIRIDIDGRPAADAETATNRAGKTGIPGSLATSTATRTARHRIKTT